MLAVYRLCPGCTQRGQRFFCAELFFESKMQHWLVVELVFFVGVPRCLLNSNANTTAFCCMKGTMYLFMHDTWSLNHQIFLVPDGQPVLNIILLAGGQPVAELLWCAVFIKCALST